MGLWTILLFTVVVRLLSGKLSTIFIFKLCKFYVNLCTLSLVPPKSTQTLYPNKVTMCGWYPAHFSLVENCKQYFLLLKAGLLNRVQVCHVFSKTCNINNFIQSYQSRLKENYFSLSLGLDLDYR